jgi:hypothetical protein
MSDIQQPRDAVKQAADRLHVAADGCKAREWVPLRSWPACAHPRQFDLDQFREMGVALPFGKLAG